MLTYLHLGTILQTHTLNRKNTIYYDTKRTYRHHSLIGGGGY